MAEVDPDYTFQVIDWEGVVEPMEAPWLAWLDGQTWKLEQGVDYQGKKMPFVFQLHRWTRETGFTRENGYQLQVRHVSHQKTVWVRLTKLRSPDG
jgi:hypothetical protein